MVLVGMENTNVVVMMTEEQVVVLRKQIAAYAVISEQLVDFYNRFSAAIAQQQDFCFYPSLSSASPPEAGMVFESPNSEALAASGEHRGVMSRQRWSPSPTQLQILENYFNKGGNAPSKGRILEITTELEKYGDIKTCNVYNWFQNRRARSKRKQQSSKPPKKTAESEADHKKRKKAKNVDSAGSHGNNSTSSEGNRAQMPTSQSCDNIPAGSEESCSHTSQIISSAPNRDVKSSGSVVVSLFDEQGVRGSSDFDGDCDYYGLIF